MKKPSQQESFAQKQTHNSKRQAGKVPQKSVQEKITPAEFWARETQKFGTVTKDIIKKKSDTVKTFDFSDIQAKIDAYSIKRKDEYAKKFDKDLALEKFYQTEIENSFNFLLDYNKLSETEKYKPLNPLDHDLAQQYSFFPKNTMKDFEGPEIYSKLNIDTLFFIFYHSGPDIRRYFAAKELKNHSWRFHMKYHTWFQRLEEPKILTEDYEQGTYVFFDFDAWCNRRKNDFTFEYKNLENIDM